MGGEVLRRGRDDLETLTLISAFGGHSHGFDMVLGGFKAAGVMVTQGAACAAGRGQGDQQAPR